MKTVTRIALLLVLTTTFVALFTACSKEQGPKVDVSAALNGLKSTVQDDKVNALVELAKAGPAAASAVPDLITLLKDPDPLVRHLAAYALGQIGPKASSAVAALTVALQDSDRQVAMDAINALRFIGDTNANVAIPNVMGGQGQ